MANEYLKVNGKLVMINNQLVKMPNETEYSDAVDEQSISLASTEELVSDILTKLTGYIDGSPKQVFDTLNTLKATYPNGASGTYLCKDNKHFYIYNGTWIDCGEYIANPFDVTLQNGTVISSNADFAEVGKGSIGAGYFVTATGYDTSTNVPIIQKANATSDIRGVTVANPAFCAGIKSSMLNDGVLRAGYSYVGFAGVVNVIDNGKCTVNGVLAKRCMSDNDGTATPSSNNMGYQIISRVNSTTIKIIVEPSADMIQRIKTDMSNKPSYDTRKGDGTDKVVQLHPENNPQDNLYPIINNASLPNITKISTINVLPPSLNLVIDSTSGLPNLDTINGTLTFYANTTFFSGVHIRCLIKEDIVIDLKTVSSVNKKLYIKFVSEFVVEFKLVNWSEFRGNDEWTLLANIIYRPIDQYKNRYGAHICINCDYTVDGVVSNNNVIGLTYLEYTRYNPNFKSIAHQGISTIDDVNGNSRLSSIKNAKMKMFDIVEIDLMYTKDNVPVCAHDDYFIPDNGSERLYISQLTYEQLQTYEVLGEKIPSFEDVCKVCKQIGLKIFIDHARMFAYDVRFEPVKNILNKYRMKNNVLYMINYGESITDTCINNILSYNKYANISLLTFGSDTAVLREIVTYIKTKMTDFNKMSISCGYALVNNNQVFLSNVNEDIDIYVFTIDNIAQYRNMVNYASGVISNKYSYKDTNMMDYV